MPATLFESIIKGGGYGSSGYPQNLDRRIRDDGCKIGGGFLYLSRTGIRKEKFYDESQVGIRLIIALAAKGK
jgi:hypothetical protein